MGKILITIGLSITAIGLILFCFPEAFRWIGKLPGDVNHKGRNFTFHFPLTTSIVASILLSLALYVIRKFL